ncbi:MAG: hypothetical protein ACRDJW_12800 [Thermomicrobiales bacterium]
MSEPFGELSEQAIRRVRRRLLSWGRVHYHDYIWRTEPDPWLTLVAEFLLQRTRSSQVEPIFRDFCTRYPTAADLVRAGPEAAHAVTKGLGIHWRGPLLYRLAVAVAKNGGIPPESLDQLGQFTGVGPYTAAAWLSLHRGKRAVIVDSNVFRWLGRMTGRPYQRDPRHMHWVNDLADRLTPRRAFRDYNYAVLDFTMSVCTPRDPRCAECPLRSDCAFGTRGH